MNKKINRCIAYSIFIIFMLPNIIYFVGVYFLLGYINLGVYGVGLLVPYILLIVPTMYESQIFIYKRFNFFDIEKYYNARFEKYYTRIISDKNVDIDYIKDKLLIKKYTYDSKRKFFYKKMRCFPRRMLFMPYIKEYYITFSFIDNSIENIFLPYQIDNLMSYNIVISPDKLDISRVVDGNYVMIYFINQKEVVSKVITANINAESKEIRNAKLFAKQAGPLVVLLDNSENILMEIEYSIFK